MKKEERKSRILARGESQDHCHVIVGDAEVSNANNEILIDVYGDATIKHLIESVWVEQGVEKWTKEHADITLERGKYKYIPQIEYDPYEDIIRNVLD